MLFHFKCIILLLSIGSIGAKENNNTKDIFFLVETPFKPVESTHQIVNWTTWAEGVEKVTVTIGDEFVATISNSVFNHHSREEEYFGYNLINNTIPIEDVTASGSFNLSAHFVGFTKVNLTLLGKEGEIVSSSTLQVGVVLSYQLMTFIYSYTLMAILIIVYINMGANLDLELIRRIAKAPVGPVIGLCSQYLCMPVIAFCLGLLIFPDNPLFRLGLFASGCAPGGGLSNMWTHLIGGSLDLSIMMTFTSTIVALAAVPLWFLTLGNVILDGVDFVIPYKNVIFSIFILIVPCFIGIGLQLKFPRVTKVMQRIITPLSLFNILFIFSFGIYANRYLFSYISWKVVAAGFGQSLCGHLAGLGVALLTRRNRKEVIAISIETAVQNNGIAFLMLKLSLEPPAGDLAVLLPGAVTLFMPILLLTALLVKFLYLKFFAPKNLKAASVNELQNRNDGNSCDAKGRESIDNHDGPRNVVVGGGTDNPVYDS